MNTPLGHREMNLTYASRCGNPECTLGELPEGRAVVIANRRIYCSQECAEIHGAASRTRSSRKGSTPRRTTRTKAAAADGAASAVSEVASDGAAPGDAELAAAAPITPEVAAVLEGAGD